MSRSTPVLDLAAFISSCSERNGELPPWAQRPHGETKIAAKNAMYRLLEWFSGGDVASLLRDVLTVTDMPRVAREAYIAIT